jgi:integrase
VHRGFKRALALAKIEDFRFHDLRHCFATWNRQAGVDLDTLADLMGHKDTRMTRRYAHITPVRLQNAVGLLEKSYQSFSTNLAHSTKKGVNQNG